MMCQSNILFFVILFTIAFADDDEKQQTPKPPYPYETEDVYYRNEKANITLAATISYPKNGFYSKACVILTPGGTGHNRDENTSGHLTFAVLGDHLTKHNISVLRYDERGIANSTGDFKNAHMNEFVDDVIVGIEYMRSRKEFQNCKLGVIGHSKGGLTAQMTANNSNLVDFLVLLGSPGFDQTKGFIQRIKMMQKSLGKSDDEIAMKVKYAAEIYEMLKSTDDIEEIKAKLLTVHKKYLSYNLDYNTEQDTLDFSDAWIKDSLEVDFDLMFKNIKVPVLGLWGSVDRATNAKDNLKGIAKGLTLNNNLNYTLMIIPKLNHLMQTAINGSKAEYPILKETFSPVALNIISNWINTMI